VSPPILLSPSRQGDHLGTCGFYAAGNALGWLFHDVDPDQIFKAMFSIYQKNGDLKHFVRGVDRNTLNRVLKFTAEAVTPERSLAGIRTPFWSQPAESLASFKETITRHFADHRDAAAIIGYDFYRSDAKRGRYGHWTVVIRVTGRSMKTFDSQWERTHIPFSQCRVRGIATKHRARPYCLDTTCTFLLWREEGG
jgi:hypothetical protein